MTDYKDRVSGWSTDIDWSKAPEGATHYFAPFFYKVEGLRMYLFETSWEPSAYSSLQMDRLGVKIPPLNQPWSGDGLPPVGTECEVLNNDLSNAAWEKCTILFSGKHRIVYDSESCSERVGYRDCLQFRPIKTQAQIAAEERETAIEAIEQVTGLRSRDGRRDVALSIYEAGYRLTKGSDK